MKMLNKHGVGLCVLGTFQHLCGSGSLAEVTLLWHSFFSCTAVAPLHGFITKALSHLHDITCQTNHFSPPTCFRGFDLNISVCCVSQCTKKGPYKSSKGQRCPHFSAETSAGEGTLLFHCCVGVIDTVFTGRISSSFWIC